MVWKAALKWRLKKTHWILIKIVPMIQDYKCSWTSSPPSKANWTSTKSKNSTPSRRKTCGTTSPSSWKSNWRSSRKGISPTSSKWRRKRPRAKRRTRPPAVTQKALKKTSPIRAAIWTPSTVSKIAVSKWKLRRNSRGKSRHCCSTSIKNRRTRFLLLLIR